MPRLDELEHWVPTQTAAKRLGRSRQGAINLAKDQKVRAVQIGARAPDVTKASWAFDPKSIDAFLAQEQEQRKEKKEES